MLDWFRTTTKHHDDEELDEELITLELSELLARALRDFFCGFGLRSRCLGY